MTDCWDLTIWLDAHLMVGDLMGIQTVGSQDVDGGSKQSQLQFLARQNSMYNLTLDEVQSQLGDLGKPLLSMNLDELLKSVWTAESNHPLVVDAESGSVNQPTLQCQQSLSLTGDLSKKTVDEVWRDIQRGQSKNNEKNTRDKQPTLGEMTLEDFLVKAGVVIQGSLGKKSDSSVVTVEPSAASQFSPQGQWMQYQQPQYQNPQQNMMGVYMPIQPIAQPVPLGVSTVMDIPYIENQMPLPSPLMGTLSDTQASNRKMFAPEDPLDKSVERRQKRMIKNRESAARSRARKQAYTSELESKVLRLQEETERLRKRKKLLQRLPCAPPPQPKYQLRRTSSSPF